MPRALCDAGFAPLLAAVALASSPHAVLGQSRELMEFSAAAGLYTGFGGSPGTLNGPVLSAAGGRERLRGVWLGAQLDYRDDADGGGRSQALGVGVRIRLEPRLAGGALYLPLALGAEYAWTSRRSQYFGVDVESGVYVRGGVGLGLRLGAGNPRPYLEGRASWSRAGDIVGLVAGLSSQSAGRPAWGAAALVTSQLHPAGETYQYDDVSPGYAITVQRHTGITRLPLRASLGIDFLRFPGFSTGVVEVLGGIGWSPLPTSDAEVALVLVPQVGVLLFMEPSGTPPKPAAALGLELTLRPWLSGGLLLGVHGLAGSGPAGGFFALQPRAGLVVPL